jgi:hypothetical protein
MMMPYNCDSVIINVGSLVKLLLQLGVTLARPKTMRLVWMDSGKGTKGKEDILNTTRVQSSTIHRSGNHFAE